MFSSKVAFCKIYVSSCIYAYTYQMKLGIPKKLHLDRVKSRLYSHGMEEEMLINKIPPPPPKKKK